MNRINCTATNYRIHEPVNKLCVQTLNIIHILFFIFVLLTNVEEVYAIDKHSINFTPQEKSWLAKKHTIRVQYWQHPPSFDILNISKEKTLSENDVYTQTCSACHLAGSLGTPKQGATVSWNTRLKASGGLEG